MIIDRLIAAYKAWDVFCEHAGWPMQSFEQFIEQGFRCDEVQDRVTGKYKGFEVNIHPDGLVDLYRSGWLYSWPHKA